MLFMVIETFKNGSPKLAGERFLREGRMLPDGVVYHTSWMESTGARCFQVMESRNPELLQEWIRRWDDLIDFDVALVLTSAEFWAAAQCE